MWLTRRNKNISDYKQQVAMNVFELFWIFIFQSGLQRSSLLLINGNTKTKRPQGGLRGLGVLPLTLGEVSVMPLVTSQKLCTLIYFHTQKVKDR